MTGWASIESRYRYRDDTSVILRYCVPLKDAEKDPPKTSNTSAWPLGETMNYLGRQKEVKGVSRSNIDIG